MKKKRAPRELPLERLVTTEELAGILGEHPATAVNKSNPEHDAFDPDHPKPIRGPKGSLFKWWLPDAYDYIAKLRKRSIDANAERAASEEETAE
jgi:hypothetical protein